MPQLLSGCATYKFHPTVRKSFSVTKGHLQSFRKGGTATQLTTQESMNRPHLVAGRQTDSVCQRQAGNFDVFVMPSNGGAPPTPDHQLGRRNPFRIHARRQVYPFLRRHSGPGRSALFPSSAMTELYKVPATGGRTEQVLGTPPKPSVSTKRATCFLPRPKGFEDQWRKHHTLPLPATYGCTTAVQKHTTSPATRAKTH